MRRLSSKLKAIGARQAFILPDTGSEADRGRPHLQICLTDPCEKGDILCVSVGTYESGMDKTCLLKAGDHSYIVHLSTIYYGTPRKMPAAATLKRINDGELTEQGLISEPIFLRVCKGMLTSDFRVPTVEEYAKAQWKRMGLKVE